ncbi:MAG: FAD-dependent oxidoreductase [Desulfosarcinaceae bacterium]
MQAQYDSGGDAAGANEIAFMNQLRNTFDQLPNDIDLYLFTAPGIDDVFAQSIRQVVRAFREVTDKIRFREFNLEHEMARTYGVTEGPTLLVSPERYNITWMGAPMGEEGRTFLELLIFAGLGRSNLSEQSQKMMARLDAPRDIKVFVSPTCPYCPQEAVNGIKAAIERPDLVSLELIDIQCRPDLADRYNAHSVPQAYANEVLGLAAGIYAERIGINTVVVERDALGGQVSTTPVVENYPGFPQIGGKTLVDIMVTHALQYVQVFKGEEVLSIEPGNAPGDVIEVKTTRRRFKTKTLLLATGANHVHLGVPGEERFSGRGVSYCATCDGPLFTGKKVFMVGGGNSAVTEAMHLKPMGVDVTLVHRRDTLRAQEVLIHQLEEAGVPILWNTEVKEIQGEEKVKQVVVVNNQSGETTTLAADGVFIAVGYAPTVELARQAGVDLTEEGYIKHDEKHRTNIPGIYSAGDVEGGYKQIVTATGQGSAAAMTIFEDLINPYWKKEKAQEAEA